MAEKFIEFDEKKEVPDIVQNPYIANSSFEKIFEVISLTIDCHIEKHRKIRMLNISHLVEEIKNSKILGL